MSNVRAFHSREIELLSIQYSAAREVARRATVDARQIRRLLKEKGFDEWGVPLLIRKRGLKELSK